MHLKTSVVLIFLFAKINCEEKNAEVDQRISMPKLEGDCNKKNLTGTCCVSIKNFGDQKTGCFSFKLHSNKMAVDVDISYNDKHVGDFTIDPTTPLPCIPTPIGKMCLITRELEFKKAYAKICPNIKAHIMGGAFMYDQLPCLEYKNKKLNLRSGR